MVEPSARHPEAPEPDPQGRCVCGEKVTIADAREVTLPKRSCRLAGLLPRVRRTSVRDSSQSDGQLSQQAEAACGVDGAAPPGWTTCDSAPLAHQFCSAAHAKTHPPGNGPVDIPPRELPGERVVLEELQHTCCRRVVGGGVQRARAVLYGVAAAAGLIWHWRPLVWRSSAQGPGGRDEPPGAESNGSRRL